MPEIGKFPHYDKFVSTTSKMSYIDFMPNAIVPTIQSAMEQHGINQSELSRRTGINLRTIQRWMNGQAPSAINDLERIMSALGLSIKP